MSESPDLIPRIQRATAAIDPGLTDRDVERLVKGAARRLHRRGRRRTMARVAFGAMALGALVLAGVRFFPHFVRQDLSTAPNVATQDGGSLRLGDGSLATPLEPGSALTLVRESTERVDLALGRGRARFDVVPSAKRVFSVHAGDVTVTVLGTAFTVERVADRIGVTVERGTVRVDWRLGTRLLHKGESGWFPPLLLDPGRQAEQVERPHPTVLAPAVSTRKDPASKRVASRDAIPETAEALLAEADAERLAGHGEQGAAILGRLLRQHPHDARAPLAAFTLGRLLLMELGHPREAAEAFAQVRALAPRGPFAEDALAREVEAWKRAGDADKARVRAREYVKNYPGGRRLNTVRTLGELE